jgi:hypothetical protein
MTQWLDTERGRGQRDRCAAGLVPEQLPLLGPDDAELLRRVAQRQALLGQAAAWLQARREDAATHALDPGLLDEQLWGTDAIQRKAKRLCDVLAAHGSTMPKVEGFDSQREQLGDVPSVPGAVRVEV